MRMILQFSIPVEAGNTLARTGAMGSVLENILSELKPEAAYFFADEKGQRSGVLVFDMKEPSQIPGFVEPFFLALNASVHLQPAMTVEDFAAAGPSIGAAVKKYGG